MMIPKLFEDRFRGTWARTDALFGLVAPEAMLARPIALRHPFLFYVGHLPAFAWNHICRGMLGCASFQPFFDQIFDRGIDPDVDNPEQCHPHPEVPDRWPSLEHVIAYRDRVRKALIAALPRIEAYAATDVMARHCRVLSMAIEHELMHQETLLYIVQQLPLEQIVRPSDPFQYDFHAGVPPRTVEIAGGEATLGATFDKLDFGWDNEFPSHAVDVPAFAVDSTPVTNGQFCDFIESGGYDDPELWSGPDWAWKQSLSLTHPLGWSRRDGQWWYRTLLDVLPLSRIRDWPVCASLAEARAYARWSGARLPTEAEFHRAAFSTPGGGEQRFPWGADPATSEFGNFDFADWSPRPVGSSPRGVSAWGVHELIGNGWEWTDSPFAPFPRFNAYIARYPGYSADFFDGKHYVVKGASWATGAPLVRRSFRNWYQARYPYVFSKFRCVRASD